MSGPRLYALTFRLPLIVWYGLFFVGPLLFTVAMSFFLVKNYRMVEAFETVNWVRMFGRGFFWDAYWRTLGLAGVAALLASVIAFPAAYALAFRASEAQRRWAISLLIIPFFTSYLVRIFSWYVILAEAGVVNAMIGTVGLGPFTMLNTMFGTVVGYLTLVLPLVVILQTLALSAVDRDMVHAAGNLGCPPRRLLGQIIIPASRTGLIIAALIAFILSFGDFVSPYYLGGSKPPTLPILIIDTTKSGQQWPRAAVVAIVMIATLLTIAFAAVTAAYAKRGTSS
ncbi:MAG: ABC transporter permease [Pseudomonadota bacterium]